MATQLGIDTNLLDYAEGEGDEHRCGMARELFRRLPADAAVLPLQVLEELHSVPRRRYRWAAERTGRAVHDWADLDGARESSWKAFEAAIAPSAAHGLAIWDALIVSIAAEHQCAALLTEDMQGGFVWRGVIIVNPFTQPEHPLLRALPG